MINDLDRAGGVAKGSIFDMSQRRKVSLTDTLTDISTVVMIDVSGSMGGTKHANALEALVRIQNEREGKIGIISFSTFSNWQFQGIIPSPSGGTNMTEALKMAHDFDDTDVEFILISDGMPDNQDSAWRWAEQYKSKIHTIFIGDDHYGERGRSFLERLAKLTGGISSGQVDSKMLGTTIRGLLE